LEIIERFLYLLSGFIDSVIGGGGLITIPLLKLHIHTDVYAIGTNKLYAATSSILSIFFLTGFRFSFNARDFVFMGSFVGGGLIGTLIAPQFPTHYVEAFFWVIAPLVLVLVLMRKSFSDKPDFINLHPMLVASLAAGVGLYDGILGPGSSLFLFFILFYLSPYDLRQSLILTKTANAMGASLALTSYGLQERVEWAIGLHYFPYLVAGAVIGSWLVNRHAELVVRPLLIMIVTGLLVKMYVY
jgi:uncharacterized membrane protein YfcA